MNIKTNFLDMNDIFIKKPKNVHSIFIGFKIKNNLRTDEISVVYNVQKKLPPNELSNFDVVPSDIIIGNQPYKTDVQESDFFKFFTCYVNESLTPSSSYVSTNQEVTRLQGFSSSALLPMRGGQQIVQYPTNWTPQNNGSFDISVGTMGCFCVDQIDGRIVGLTNSHVLINRKALVPLRNPTAENIDPYNIYENRIWSYDSSSRSPGGILTNGSGSLIPACRIKRYFPIKNIDFNYIDVCVVMMEPSVISNQSYKMWSPISEPDYNNFMPFASTAEINNMLISRPYLYSTGRTTGPKGFGQDASCRLVVEGLGGIVTVRDNEPDIKNAVFADTILMRYEDSSNWPGGPGDSGSAVVANFGGTRKIIGLLFAGTSNSVIICRIDRIADVMKVKAWDGSYNITTPTFKGLLVDYYSNNAFQETVTYGGKTYYQAGYTKMTDLPVLP